MFELYGLESVFLHRSSTVYFAYAFLVVFFFFVFVSIFVVNFGLSVSFISSVIAVTNLIPNKKTQADDLRFSKHYKSGY